MALDSETFYEHQRAIADNWGIVLPSWNDLSWDEHIAWEEKFAEQINRDKEFSDQQRT